MKNTAAYLWYDQSYAEDRVQEVRWKEWYIYRYLQHLQIWACAQSTVTQMFIRLKFILQKQWICCVN